MSAPTSHMIVAWRFQTPDGDAPVRAAEDDVGRVIVFAEPEYAETFAGRLRAWGIDAEVVAVTSTEVAELLGHNLEQPHEDDTTLFEASSISAEDAARWARELADRMIAALAAAFNAAVPGDQPE